MQRNLLLLLGALVIIGIVVFARPQPKLTEAELLDKSWGTFQEYLAAAKDHDLPRLKSVAHQISATCEDESKREECYGLMDGVYEIGKEFKREDFKNIYADGKQVIIFTDYRVEESDLAKAFSKKVIYLTRKRDNSLKILFFTLPEQLTFTYKVGRTPEEVDARLAQMIVDTDQDGRDDEVETCVITENCVETDPTKRDTDGDGWWDSVEVLFRTD